MSDLSPTAWIFDRIVALHPGGDMRKIPAIHLLNDTITLAKEILSGTKNPDGDFFMFGMSTSAIDRSVMLDILAVAHEAVKAWDGVEDGINTPDPSSSFAGIMEGIEAEVASTATT